MTTTPRDDAGRSIDRTMAAAILDRLDRGKQPIPGEAAMLRAVLTAEQADGDQAREQRDQAAASLTDLRNDLYRERRAHEEHRRQLAEALGGMDADTPWDGLIRRATQVLAGRHRAFDMAQEIEADRDRLAAELREVRDELEGETKRAEKAERAVNLLADAERNRQAAEIGLTELRKQLDLAEISARANKTAITEITERAEQAEATITRVRAVLRPRDEDDVTEWQRGHRACSIVALNALDHEQPATEPEPGHACGNCEGIDSEDCPNNPHRPAPRPHPIVQCSRTATHPTHLHLVNRHAHRCPGLTVDDRIEKPAAPDGAALWAVIKPHALDDLPWWDTVRHRLGNTP